MKTLMKYACLLIALHTVHYCWAAQLRQPRTPLLQQDDNNLDQLLESAHYNADFAGVMKCVCYGTSGALGLINLVQAFHEPEIQKPGATSIALGSIVLAASAVGIGCASWWIKYTKNKESEARTVLEDWNREPGVDNRFKAALRSQLKYYGHVKDSSTTIIALAGNCMTTISASWMPVKLAANILHGTGGIAALATPIYLAIQDYYAQVDAEELADTLEGVPS